MNVFGVGPAELLLILVVALVFVGPERLPRLAADLARTIREIRKYTGALQSEFTEYVKEVEKQTEGERSEWKQLGDGIGSATQSVTDALRSVRTGIEPGATPAAAAPPAPPASSAAAATTASEPEWKEIGTGLTEAPAASTNGHTADGAHAAAPEAATNGAAAVAVPAAAPAPEERA